MSGEPDPLGTFSGLPSAPKTYAVTFQRLTGPPPGEPGNGSNLTVEPVEASSLRVMGMLGAAPTA